MPWRQLAPLDQKTQLIAEYRRNRLSVTARCALDGVSRPTGDNGMARYRAHGPQGLDERSRRPSTSPRHTPADVVAASLEARQRHPSWGAKKLVAILRTRHPRWPWPARSTVWDILSRHGWVPKQRRRRVLGHPGKPISHIGAPNEVWSAGCTGHFKTGDGRYCDPLTSSDGYSRFLLACQALSSTSVPEAKPVFTRVFKAFGLPQRLRTDHGVPLATNTLARLSQLSAWWGRLGIVPEFIAPGKPHQNGRHERMPRPRKADTTRPPAATLRAQQRKVNHFREEFNQARPPEALDMRTPAAGDEPSPRKRPAERPPLESPARFEVRDVSANGGIRGHHRGVNVSTTCAGEYVGLAEIDAGVGNVDCGPLKRGRLRERHRRLDDA